MVCRMRIAASLFFSGSLPPFCVGAVHSPPPLRLSQNVYHVIASDPAMAGERGNPSFMRNMRDCFVVPLSGTPRNDSYETAPLEGKD